MAYLISEEAQDLLKDVKKFCDNEVREQCKEYDKSGEWPKEIYDKAIDIYEKLVKLKPEEIETRAFLGYLYYENEELDKAEENFNKALDVSTEDEPFILFLLGNIYSRKGKISEAVDCYELAIFLDFDMYVAHIDFARKYEHMGRHQKALEEYRAAFRIDSRDEGLIEKINYIENKCKNLADEDKKVNFSGANLGIV